MQAEQGGEGPMWNWQSRGGSGGKKRIGEERGGGSTSTESKASPPSYNVPIVSRKHHPLPDSRASPLSNARCLLRRPFPKPHLDFRPWRGTPPSGPPLVTKSTGHRGDGRTGHQ